MGKVTGFLEYQRQLASKTAINERIKHHKEFVLPMPQDKLVDQAARCMDCAVPSCHQGCPLGNLIPDWNNLVYQQDWRQAYEELHRTNNFPEITGRVCPAPCEDICILGIPDKPVSIKMIELEIITKGFNEGWVKPIKPQIQRNKTVAIVGSGPAGMAAAQQLVRNGYNVDVYEKSDRLGGLLTYGLPDFKLEPKVVEQRITQMREEGVRFHTNVEVGADLSIDELEAHSDALLLAGGAQQARALAPEVDGRNLGGIHLAMDFLTQQNRINLGDSIPAEQRINAEGKRVVILGGGDTGADCVGTAHRQGAKAVFSFEIMPQPKVVRQSTSHEEGGQRRWGVMTKSFFGHNGMVQGLRGINLEWTPPPQPTLAEVTGSDFEMPIDLVILAMGFTGPLRQGLLSNLGVELTERGNVKYNANYQTSVPGVFVAGDMGRGASLVVWAIWEGREAAESIHRYIQSKP